MQQAFSFSETTDALDEALAKVQGAVEAALKDSVNPHFKNKYADLTAVWDACREPLKDNGINVTQWPVHGDDDRLHMITRVACKGQWMMAHFSMPVPQQTPQGFGSAITYAKRYTLSAALGIVADDDDDGNTASQGQAKQQAQTRQQKPAQKQPTEGEKALAATIRLAVELASTAAEVQEVMKANDEQLAQLGDLGTAIRLDAKTKWKRLNEQAKGEAK